MQRPRPVAALLAGLFALQLLLAVLSSACPMLEHGRMAGPAGAVATGAASDAAMEGMPMGDAASAAATPVAVADAGLVPPSPDAAPCDTPMSPEQCQKMAPCAAGVPAPARALEPPPSHRPPAVVAALVSMPPSVSSAPELPPPRA